MKKYFKKTSFKTKLSIDKLLYPVINIIKMKTRFFLKKQKGKDESFIYLAFRSRNGVTFNLSTGQKIKNMHWDKKYGLPRGKKESVHVRNTILNYGFTLDRFIRNKIMRTNRQPTKDELKEHIKWLFHGTEPDFYNSIEHCIKEYLEDNFQGTTYSTRKSRIHLLNHFAKFIGSGLKIYKINQSDLKKYRCDLLTNTNFQFTTVNNYLKSVKAFLRWIERKKDIKIDLWNLQEVKIENKNIKIYCFDTSKKCWV